MDLQSAGIFFTAVPAAEVTCSVVVVKHFRIADGNDFADGPILYQFMKFPGIRSVTGIVAHMGKDFRIALSCRQELPALLCSG